jgi:PUA-domain protein
VSDFRIRKRVRLKAKQAKPLRDSIQASLPGIELWDESAAVETGSLPDFDVILVDGVIHGVVQNDQSFLSVRGLLAYRPTEHSVTVDMGAIRFVHNGADVMAPGITAADENLQEGDWCWIKDEKNGQPLAIGRCVMPGAAMVGAKGKAVKSVHHLGDKVWELDA